MLDELIAETVVGSALITVIETRGSAPRHVGSKMLVKPDGTTTGTVGGGKGEFLAATLARACIAGRRSDLIEVDMTGDSAEGQDLICGGTNRMLVEFIADDAPYRAAGARLSAGERVLFIKRTAQGTGGVATVLLDESGAAMYGAGLPLDREAAAGCLRSGKPSFDAAGSILYDPVLPGEKLLILGGGHVGKAVALAAAPLGFRVTVADDRAEYADPAALPPGTETIAGPFPGTIARFPFDASTYVVIVTRGHQCDLECLRAVLARTYRYAGLIGSRRKSRMLLDQVRADGVSPDRIATIHTPIGLAIGAETPAEIAISILAEIIAVRRMGGMK